MNSVVFPRHGQLLFKLLTYGRAKSYLVNTNCAYDSFTQIHIRLTNELIRPFFDWKSLLHTLETLGKSSYPG